MISGSEDLVRASELAELAVVEASGDDAARARALEVASVIDMNLGHPGRARQRAAVALQIFGGLGDSHGAARILDARAMATFLDSDIRLGTELAGSRRASVRRLRRPDAPGHPPVHPGTRPGAPRPSG